MEKENIVSILSGGIIPNGKYSCEILINERLYKTINFEIKQSN
jgi:hypothetical protein